MARTPRGRLILCKSILLGIVLKLELFSDSNSTRLIEGLGRANMVLIYCWNGLLN